MTSLGPMAAANLWARVLRRTRRALDEYLGGSSPPRPPDAVDRDRERAKEHDRRVWRDVARSLPPMEPAPISSDDKTLLRASRLVDDSWYRERIGDPAADAVEHYLTVGADRGLDPSPLFRTDWYRREHGVYLPRDQNPLAHYLREGHRRGLTPSPNVDLDEVRLRLDASDEPLAALLRLRAEVDVPAIQASLRTARPPATPLDDTELRWRDLIEDRISDDESFVLYRILGNDLPPRHRSGQSEHNLRFLLDEEPELPGCEKRYVVNRIVDPTTETRLIQLLESRGVPYLHIPFVEDEYRQVGWRVSDFHQRGLLYGTRHDALPATSRARALDHAYHDKNRYVMHNNGGRNRALADGRARARWVLPFDGNCFFTRSAWEGFREAVLAAPHRRYVLVPMSRVNENELLLDPDNRMSAGEEPQIAFRSDADETFDEDRRYGRRPKVELLQRLGVPGPWDTWPDEPWEAPRSQRSPDAGEQHTAGWVARMASGAPKLESDSQQRMLSRMDAIRGCLRDVDERLIRQHFDPGELQTRSEAVMEQQRRDGTVAGCDVEPLIGAELTRHLARSRATHRIIGGERATDLGDLLATRAFGGWLLEDDELLDRARRTMDAWVAAELSGHPHRAPHLGDVLDAIVLLQRTGVIERHSVADVRRCVRRRAGWLRDSRPGTRRRRSVGADGTRYELEMLACQAFLDDAKGITETFARVAARCHDQFHDLAEGPTSRRQGSTWSIDNVLSWQRLLQLGQRYGVTLLDDRSRGLHGLQRACEAMGELADGQEQEPFEPQHGALDWRRGVGSSPMTKVSSTLADSPPLWWAGTVS